MTPKELREAVASAIRNALCLSGSCVRDEICSDASCACCLEAGDAALAAVWEALREPDAGMHEAGFKKSIGGQMGEWMPEGFPAINAAIYRAMLAASPLAEGNGDA